MRRRLSLLFILLGVGMILGAAALLLHNRQEAEQAASISARVLPVLSEYLEEAAETATAPPPLEDPHQPSREMPVVEIDGLPCLGVLSIPAIDYVTPVFADCTESLLRAGACRYFGDVYRGGFVICAHNYDRLYSRVPALRTGDLVWFTDMDGLTWTYEVADLETLGGDQVAEMTDSGYDLSFFTCSYGGQSRLTLRCVRTGELNDE